MAIHTEEVESVLQIYLKAQTPTEGLAFKIIWTGLYHCFILISFILIASLFYFNKTTDFTKRHLLNLC